MEQITFEGLGKHELHTIVGGGVITDAVVWFLGACFITPGKVALDGNANSLSDY